MGMVEQSAAAARENARLEQEAAVGRAAMAERAKAAQWEQLDRAKEVGMAEVLNGLKAEYNRQVMSDPRYYEPKAAYPDAPIGQQYKAQVENYRIPGRNMDGSYENSVVESPTILPDGRVLSAAEEAGLAQALRDEASRVQASVSPRADTPNPTYGVR